MGLIITKAIKLNINNPAPEYAIILPINSPVFPFFAFFSAINGTTRFSIEGANTADIKSTRPYAKKKASVYEEMPNQIAIKKGIKKPIDFPKVPQIVVETVSLTKGLFAKYIYIFFILLNK